MKKAIKCEVLVEIHECNKYVFDRFDSLYSIILIFFTTFIRYISSL
jgi:hypothetical protein